MARFRHRTEDTIVAATRLMSPKEVETGNKGWITAGVGNWEIHSLVPGKKPVVLQDPEFRDAYEANDASATKALDAPDPGTLGPQHNHVQPAAPDHSKVQNLAPAKTARQAADEQRRKDEAAQAATKAAEAAAQAERDAATAADDAALQEAEAHAHVDEDAEVDAETGEADLSVETPPEAAAEPDAAPE